MRRVPLVSFGCLVSDPLLTEEAAAAELGIPRNTLKFHRLEGRIGFYKFGRHVKFSRAHLEAYKRANERKAVGE